ncbi:hypothetical protein EJB10_00555 [Wolbachia endosymbiont of Brugia malayi]|uniref:hypothetical protein n=1 Tax=Wolbachia endosymbiont of Brugia malayi TaxID=80849 RepID=UPI00030D6532|nr:hypothetical protein [Wolbachia endosymbiont of Brugia malayi]QCB61380.1 hypothetical protein EJB10_00555 [Wolbachia endosymbiont of Brugia malayi]
MEPITVAVTSQTTTVTEQVTTSTHVSITNLEETTQTLFTIPSTRRIKESTTPIFITTLFP